MEKHKAPSKNERSSESTDIEMKTIKMKNRTHHSAIRNKEIPIPSHVSDTLGANPSQIRVGDDITSPMKTMTMSWGRKGGGVYDNNGRMDRLEKSMLGLAKN